MDTFCTVAKTCTNSLSLAAPSSGAASVSTSIEKRTFGTYTSLDLQSQPGNSCTTRESIALLLQSTHIITQILAEREGFEPPDRTNGR